MGFQSIFAWKALPEAAFVKKAVIDAHRSKHESIASGGFIVPQDRSFLKPRRSGKSGTSQIVSFEHAKASAALAASFKRAWEINGDLPEDDFWPGTLTNRS